MSQAHLDQPRFLELRGLSQPPLQLHAALLGPASWTKVAESAAPAPGAASTAMEEAAWPAFTQGMPVRTHVPKQIRNVNIRRHVGRRLHASHACRVLRPLRICHTRRLLGSTWVPTPRAVSFWETGIRVHRRFLLRAGCPPLGRSIRKWSRGVGVGDFNLEARQHRNECSAMDDFTEAHCRTKHTLRVCVCVYIYICMYVCMYGWMDGWMDGWMYVRVYLRHMTLRSHLYAHCCICLCKRIHIACGHGLIL